MTKTLNCNFYLFPVAESHFPFPIGIDILSSPFLAFLLFTFKNRSPSLPLFWSTSLATKYTGQLDMTTIHYKFQNNICFTNFPKSNLLCVSFLQFITPTLFTRKTQNSINKNINQSRVEKNWTKNIKKFNSNTNKEILLTYIQIFKKWHIFEKGIFESKSRI